MQPALDAPAAVAIIIIAADALSVFGSAAALAVMTALDLAVSSLDLRDHHRRPQLRAHPTTSFGHPRRLDGDRRAACRPSA